MDHLLETLESRSLMSLPTVTVLPDAEPLSMALIQPMATTALPKVTGRYTGTVKIPGVQHIRTVILTITSQTAAGVFTGVMIPTLDTSIHIAVTGKISANRKFTIKLNGTHSGGPIVASGAGTLSTNGKALTTTSLVFKQGGQNFPGSMVVKKA